MIRSHTLRRDSARIALLILGKLLAVAVMLAQTNTPPNLPIGGVALPRLTSSSVATAEPPTAGADPGQTIGRGALRDAPGAGAGSSGAAQPSDEVETKRILDIMPNFRAVTAGQAVPRQTARDKFLMASQDNFDYSSLIFAGILAGGGMAGRTTPEFHRGAAGYGRYYWHNLADQAIENYFVECILPSATHEDTRYYAMGRRGGGFFKRAGYSLSRTVVTRSDSGKPSFNYSEIAGAGAAASISSLYYPGSERTAANDLRNWGLDVGYDSFAFLLHEFWPDISHALRHRSSAAHAIGRSSDAGDAR